MAEEFDTSDSAAVPPLPKQKAPGRARGERVGRRTDVCPTGGSGTGRAHVAIARGPSLCRLGRGVRFATAAALVTGPGEARQQHRLDRARAAPGRVDRPVGGELGYLSLSRAGAELPFRVLAGRYERWSLPVTSNLPSGEWGAVFRGERMTAALLDRLTHRCDIFETNGESYRLREAMKSEPPRTSPSKK